MRTSLTRLASLLVFLASSVPLAAQTVLVASTTYDAGGTDQALGIARAPNGDLYVSGTANGDIWLARYDSSLNLLSTAAYAGSAGGYDVAYNVVRAADGTLYAVGFASMTSLGNQAWMGHYAADLSVISTVTFAAAANHDQNLLRGVAISAAGELFTAGNVATSPTMLVIRIAKHDPTTLAILSSATFYGGVNTPEAEAINADSAGFLYVTGSVPPAPATSNDLWLAKYDTSMNFLSSTTKAGPAGNSDMGRSLLVHPNGSVYVTGILNNSGPTNDLWIGKYSSDLALQSQLSINGSGSGQDDGDGLALGNNGNILVSGAITQTGQAHDIFAAEYTAELALVSSMTLTSAGANEDVGYGIVSDTASAEAAIAGYYGAASDVWLGKFSISPLSPPAAPSGFGGVAQTTTTILWSWTDNASNETGYRVMNGAANVSGDLAADTTIWLQPVSTPATSSGTLFVQAFNSSGTANSGTATRATLAAAPGTPSGSGVTGSSAAVSWTDPSNPGGLVYDLERSTGTGFGLRQSSTALSYADTGLTPGSTYWYRARAYNPDGLAGAYSSSGAVVTAPYPTLVSLAVTPSAATIPTASSAQFTAVGTFDDASTGTISDAAWSSSAPSIATVSAQGWATGLAPGSALVTASSGALSAVATVTVVGVPAAPSGFAGSAQSTGSIQWSWTDNASTELGYRVMSGAANLSGDLAAGTTIWLQNGLGVGASTGPLYAQAFNSSGTANSGTASRYSLAAAPGTPSASGVYQTSGTISWASSGNPAGTVYRLERSTGTGFGLHFSSTALSYFDEYLIPAATHYYRVLAVNGDGLDSAYSSTAAVVAAPPPALPGPAGTPAGTALGTSSITWTWVLASGATNHYLFRAADDSYLGSSTSGPFVQTALSPNTTYGLRAAGVNVGGTGPLSPSATVYTLAAAPTGAAASAIAASSMTLSWGLNGNSSPTTAQLSRSTDAVSYSALLSGAATYYADADLLGCTTYYYRVRDLNGDGIPTAYASFQAVTANTVPSPPSGLTAAANAGGTVTLAWNLSPTEGVTGYRLFWDGGSGTVSYAAPLASLSSGTASYTTGVLTSSASYTFALRAAHRCGVVETTGALAMSGAAVAPPALRAAIKEPDSGKRVHGNRVTILGELIYGTPSDAQQVLFQYKLAASTAWTNVPAANVNHPNPDLSFPYFVHWNANLPAAGDYDLRAVAYDRSGVPDAAPPAVRVTVAASAADADIDENDVAGAVEKQQTISNGVTSVVDTAGAGASDPSVRVTIPAGAVAVATAVISVISNPSIATAAPAGQAFVGSAIKIDLSNGQSALNGTAAIALTYPDTVRFPSLLQIYYLNEVTGQWTRDFASTVDTASRTVTGNTPHFSTFALMLGSAFAADLSSVQVYPVPFKPNGPDADEGRPFSSGDPNSGIIFANLAMGSEIRIYTLTGRLVARLDNVPITGTMRWDARNQDGRDVASGAYFAVIKAAGQKTAVKKLVIIR